VAVVRVNLNHALPLFTAPAAAVAAPAVVFADAPIAPRTARSPRRGVLGEPQAVLLA